MQVPTFLLVLESIVLNASSPPYATNSGFIAFCIPGPIRVLEDI